MRSIASACLLLLLVGCSPEPTPSGLEASAAADAGWRAVGPALGDCHISASVVRRSGELVAVCHDGTLRRTAVLTTRNGVDWDVVEPSGIVPRRPEDVTVLHALVETADGTLVLVGADAADDLSSGDAAVWTSADAASWTRGPRSRSIQDGAMLAAIATGSEVIAVGADGFPGANVQLPGLHGPIAWRSDSSPRWRRTPLPQGPERLLASGLAAVPGGFLAWGGAAPPGTAVAWTSPDGDAWTLESEAFGRSGPSVGGVAVSGSGVVIAVGCTWPESHEDSTPAMWRSIDGGASWATVEVPGDPGTGCFRDVIAAGDRFIATGTGARVAFSMDGEAWADAPVDATMSIVDMRNLVALGDSLIAFGSVQTEEESRSGIWRRELPR